MGENRESAAGMGAARPEDIRQVLTSWFRENGRDLPWRRTRDPWRVLVSEVMLQQIQVKRAVPFYERFVGRFPTVESLAQAPLAEAIRVWGDLGRYRRVVNLHRTARLVTEEHGGEIPSDPDVLVRLPGIGPYTAGAVACFAFEKDVPFVDTNMRRVLHRLFFGLEVPEPAAKEKEILELARSAVPSGAGWEWNQALMELGALICVARKPLCAECPLKGACRARPEADSAEWTRAAPSQPAYRYGGSNRYYRGRVLAVLREDPVAGREGIGLRELGRRIKQDFADEDMPWLHAAVESLAGDGLAKVSPRRGRLEAVAEERAPYGAGPIEAPSPQQKVSLP